LEGKKSFPPATIRPFEGKQKGDLIDCHLSTGELVATGRTYFLTWHSLHYAHD